MDTTPDSARWRRLWTGLILWTILGEVSADSKGPYFIQSFNYPAHKFGITAITDESPASIMTQGKRFFVVYPGLTNEKDTVSFEPADWPGHYLRHRDRFLFVDLKDEKASDFAKTATFKVHKDLMNKGYLTFEAANQPGFYIRHSGYKLRIDKSDGSALFKKDSSFRYQEGPFLLQSENMADHVLGLNSKSEAVMTNNNGLVMYFIHPGLTGVEGTVSFEPSDKPGYYLRHYGFLVDLEDRSNPRNPKLFDEDASFKLCRRKCFIDDYLSLEAGNIANNFLRHVESRVRIAYKEDNDVFKHDASFRTIEAPFYMESYDYPGYRADHTGAPQVSFTQQGQEFVLVYPGLTQEAGTVSIEAREKRGNYLRVTSAMNIALMDGKNEDQSSFRRAASFYIRNAPWYINSFALESAAYKGNFIVRVGFQFRVRPFENIDAFKSSASFIRSQRPPIGTPTELRASLIQSYNYPNYTFGVRFGNGDAYIMTSGKRFITQSPGLAGQPGSVSLLSVDRPDSYLRQYANFLVLESRFGPRNPAQYLDDSTFLPREDKWYRGYFALESASMKNGFIRHSGYRLMVNPFTNTELFKKDASFRRIEGPYFFQSYNFPARRIGLNVQKQAELRPVGHPWYYIHPGLSFHNGSVSLESGLERGSYLRHYEYLVDLEDINNPRNPGLFNEDATFYLRHGNFLDHYLALESVNMANHFIRHQGFRVKASSNDGTELFQQDASFRAVQGPLLLESINYRGYAMAVDNQGAVFLTRSGTLVQATFPGLTGEPGTVSIERYGSPGSYLRHRSFDIYMDQLSKSRDKDTFRADATWRLREEIFFAKSVILESVNKPNYFIRHEDYRLKITEYDKNEIFQQASSFLRVPELRSRSFESKGPYQLQSFASPDKFVTSSAKPETNGQRPASVRRALGDRFYIQSPGLTNQTGTISFASADRVNHFLRHHENTVDLESIEESRNPHLFHLEATFYPLYREDEPDQTLFEAANMAGYYLSALEGDLQLVKNNGSTKLRDLASFRFVDGPFFLESLLRPNQRINVTASQLKLSVSGHRFFMSTPGLSGASGTVSVSIAERPYSHVCMVGTSQGDVSLRDLHQFPPDTKSLLQKQCSFRVNTNINLAADMFFALESSAYSDHYLALAKHDSDTIVVKKSHSGGHIAMDEAGFRFIQGPLKVTSYNYNDQSLAVGSPPGREVSLSVNGTLFLVVAPGLNGKPGTVSLQVASNRTMYLRHIGCVTNSDRFRVYAEDRLNPRNPKAFNEDASFYPRKDMWYKDTIVLEAVNFGAHYIRHQNSRVRLSELDSSELFRQDASFQVKRLIPVEADGSSGENEHDALTLGVKIGIVMGTFFTALLLFALILNYNRIAALFCRQRAVVRREGRYDSYDGYDNPTYETVSPHFSLMYTPQGGVRMVDANQDGSQSDDVDGAKGHTASEAIAGRVTGGSAGGTGLVGMDENDIYVDMASVVKKPHISRTNSGGVRNPGFETEQMYHDIARQSSVELFVDSSGQHEEAEPETMGDSGLPGMSNLDMLSDLRRREVINEETPVGSSTQKTPDKKTQFTLTLNNRDETEEYVAPTSPIFFGMRPPEVDIDVRTPAEMKSTDFSSVDLFPASVPINRGVGTEIGANRDSGNSSHVITEDVNYLDIPSEHAPPIPPVESRHLPADDDNALYCEPTAVKEGRKKVRSSEREKATEIGRQSQDEHRSREDEEHHSEISPTLPPRNYSKEKIRDETVEPTAALDSPVPAAPRPHFVINYDDDPDDIYASIELADSGLPDCSPAPAVMVDSPAIEPPFPLETPPEVTASLSSSHASLTSLATECSDKVLGPKGELIPLPTRKSSKGNLLDLLHVFSSSEEKTAKEGKEKEKRSKTPIGLVNPLYDFDGVEDQYSQAHQTEDNSMPVSTVQTHPVTAPSPNSKGSDVSLTHSSVNNSEEDPEEKAYKLLVQKLPGLEKDEGQLDDK